MILLWFIVILISIIIRIRDDVVPIHNYKIGDYVTLKEIPQQYTESRQYKVQLLKLKYNTNIINIMQIIGFNGTQSAVIKPIMYSEYDEEMTCHIDNFRHITENEKLQLNI